MDHALKQTLAYFATVVAGQLVSFLLLPLTTHYLTPADYGQYSIALTTGGLIAVLGSSWIRNVAFRLFFDAKAEGRALGFFWGVAAYQATLVAVGYGLWFAATRLLGVGELPVTLLLFACLSTLSGDLYALASNTLRAAKQSGPFVRAELTVAALRLTGTAGALLLGFRSPSALLAASALASAIPAAYAALTFVRSNPDLAGVLPLPRDLLGRISRLGLASLPHSLGIWVIALSDRFVLEWFAGQAVVGLYSVGYSLADRLINGLVAAVFLVSWPRILQAWTEQGRGGAREQIYRALRLYLWLTLGPLVFLIRFRVEVVALLTGEAYQSAVLVIPAVSVAAWVWGLATYLSRPLELEKRYLLMSGVTLTAAAVNLGLNLMLVPGHGAVGAAWATLAAYLSAGLLLLCITNRELLRFPARDLVLAGGLCAALWTLSLWVPGSWWNAAVLFALLYGLSVAWTLSDEVVR